MFNSIFQALIEYLYAEVIVLFNGFFSQMNSMGADTMDLPWIKAIVLFFHQFGWALFLAGIVVAIFETAIEAQNGKPAVRDLALNLFKGLLAVSLFTAVPVELFKTSISLQGDLADALCRAFQQQAFTGIGGTAANTLFLFSQPTPFNIFVIIIIGYSVIKVFFGNIKRGGILVVNLAVGALYMLSVPRGYMDGFTGWCRQVAALCVTAFLQSTLLTAGLLTIIDHPLLGLGLALSANEVPRIAERFGMDSSVKVNFMSTYYAINSAVNMAKGIAKAVAK